MFENHLWLWFHYEVLIRYDSQLMQEYITGPAVDVRIALLVLQLEGVFVGW